MLASFISGVTTLTRWLLENMIKVPLAFAKVGPLATEFQKSQSPQLLFSTEVNVYSHLFLYILTAAVHAW